MRVFKILLASGFLAVFLIGAILFLVGYFKPKAAGILVETAPAATVFIDGIQVGRTAYEATRKPGEVTLRLVPLASDRPLAPFESRVTLSSGIKTVVRREFGETEDASSGEIISFEKVGGSQAPLAVVSIPDLARISIDGKSYGFAPYQTSTFAAGEHQVVLTAPGFLERILSFKTISGYKLTAYVKLALNKESEKPKEEEPKKIVLVEILSTPTGFLRVRSEPKSGSELFQVKPGQTFPFLEEDTDSGWFKIEYQEGKEGWVSNEYSKKISRD